VSVPPTLVNKPTESNASSWQELGYPDPQTALLCQRIADQKTTPFQRQLLLAQLKRPRLPTPSEIGLRQIATAQPVQPGGADPSPQTAGIKISDVEVGEKRKYLVRDVPNTTSSSQSYLASMTKDRDLTT
jgi:hypothetical protein